MILNLIENMTSSPAIGIISDKKGDKKSPSHSSNGANRATSRADGRSNPLEQPQPFRWLRVFRVADLLTKQGC